MIVMKKNIKMNISFTTIIVNEVQISIKLELRGKKKLRQI